VVASCVTPGELGRACPGWWAQFGLIVCRWVHPEGEGYAQGQWGLSIGDIYIYTHTV
jgi:hypothetical protein